MVLFLKLLIIASVVGLLRTSQTFRSLSREADEAALLSLKKIMRATEESGYPPEMIFLLIAFSVIVFVAMLSAIQQGI